MKLKWEGYKRFSGGFRNEELGNDPATSILTWNCFLFYPKYFDCLMCDMWDMWSLLALFVLVFDLCYLEVNARMIIQTDTVRRWIVLIRQLPHIGGMQTNCGDHDCGPQLIGGHWLISFCSEEQWYPLIVVQFGINIRRSLMHAKHRGLSEKNIKENGPYVEILF